MSPLREHRSVLTRYKDDTPIDPFRRYYLIFEGKNTEKKYFQGIEGYRKELDINSAIELVILSKEGEIRDYSSPQKLLELINQKKDQLKSSSSYDEKIDRFVIVFDRDSFDKEDKYFEFLKIAGEDNILSITSPCFEIWLLLHYENAIEAYFEPNKFEILENKKVSAAHSYTSRLCSEVSGVNPKNNVNFPNIKDRVSNAIEEEKKICQANDKMFNVIGSNVGVLINEMKTKL
ncbi:MAG: RloB domain-containing protein [Clostridia bacterium]|nr:RloB domain-containing protein [Clostridia bacterium]